MSTKQKIMRTKEAANYCSLGKSTLEKKRLSGTGPAYMKLGRSVVYAVDDLDSWLLASRRLSTSENPGFQPRHPRHYRNDNDAEGMAT